MTAPCGTTGASAGGGTRWGAFGTEIDTDTTLEHVVDRLLDHVLKAP
ncbi:hypothetical protein AB0A73_03795 [Glycomyces sp. NPDC047369]